MSIRWLAITMALVGTVLYWAPTPSGAVTIQVSGGELIGALNVEVNDALYNVEFVEGTCAGLRYTAEAAISGVMSLMPCALRACSAAFFIASSSVGARITPGQSKPTSLQRMTFSIALSSRWQEVQP
jgi:hypothetical protein